MAINKKNITLLRILSFNRLSIFFNTKKIQNDRNQ